MVNEGANTGSSAATHVVLIGMMGSGKSSVGRALSSRLERPLFDSDEMIEERAGCTIREIWATDGEAEFRRMETEALRDNLARVEPSVIATGGGIVVSDENRKMLTESDAHVVWLMLDVEMLLERVRKGAHRPFERDSLLCDNRNSPSAFRHKRFELTNCVVADQHLVRTVCRF